LNSNTGVISGTPTALTSPRNYTFSVTNTGSGSIGTLSVTLWTDQTFGYVAQSAYLAGQPIPALSPAAPLPSLSGVSWNIHVDTSQGGVSLPAGLSVNSTSGVISGTLPLGTNYFLSPYDITATDQSGLLGSRTFRLYFRVVPRLLASDASQVCITQDNGALYCWAKPSANSSSFTSPVILDPAFATRSLRDYVTSVTVGAGMVCALTQKGYVQCFMPGSPWSSASGVPAAVQAPPSGSGVGQPTVQGPVAALVGSENVVCAILTTGQVNCWAGPNPTSVQTLMASVPIGLPAVYHLSLGETNVYATTSNGVRCWGSNCGNWLPNVNSNYLSQNVGIAGATVVGSDVYSVTENSTSLGEVCFLDKHAGVYCYAKSSSSYIASGNTGSNYFDSIQKMASSPVSRCALMSTAAGQQYLNCRASSSESIGGATTEFLSTPQLAGVIYDVSTSVVRSSANSASPIEYLSQCTLFSDRVLCWNNAIAPSKGYLWAQSDVNTFGPLELSLKYAHPNYVTSGQIVWNWGCINFLGRPMLPNFPSSSTMLYPGDAQSRMINIANRNYYYYGSGTNSFSNSPPSLPSLNPSNVCGRFLVDQSARCNGVLPVTGSKYETSYAPWDSTVTSNAWYYQNECKSYDSVNGAPSTFTDYTGQIAGGYSSNTTYLGSYRCTSSAGKEWAYKTPSGGFARLCRLAGSSCPGLGSNAVGWSTTTSNGIDCTWHCGGGASSSSHSWSATMDMSCGRSCNCVGGPGAPCPSMTEIGCSID
jgi:hypothetical protein